MAEAADDDDADAGLERSNTPELSSIRTCCTGVGVVCCVVGLDFSLTLKSNGSSEVLAPGPVNIN